MSAVNVVVDTNVLVSGVINPHGKPAQILNLLLNGKITILYDNRIIHEYSNVLHRQKFGFAPEEIEPLLDFVKMEGEYVVPNPVKLSFSDESDKKFFEIFMGGNAQYLITGNKNHFPHMKRIVSPSDFLESFL